MRRCFTVLLVMVLFALSACTNNAPEFEASFDIVGTKHNQYFAVKADALLVKINDELSAAELSLADMSDAQSRNAFYTENGDTWKIGLSTFLESDVKDSSYPRSNPSSDPSTWVGYIQDIELSLYSNSEDMSQRNGHYLRALISVFTPGAEEFVEDTLGIYGTPRSGTEFAAGTYKITVGTVSYIYQPDSKRFLIQPYDKELETRLNTPVQTQNITRPT